MKKWIIVAASLILLFFTTVYFFIPAKIIVARSVTANANSISVYRFLADESNWKKWWPDPSSVNKYAETSFESGKYRFKRTKTLFNSFEISIATGKYTSNSLLYIFPRGNDSIKIEWNATLNTGINPFSKIQCYLKARELGHRLEVILTALKKHISHVKHIYGIDIRREKVQIEFMVSTKKTFTHYPKTEVIYEMLGQIKKYIAHQQAKEEDYPMLHVTVSDSAAFETQVAIPVNKQLPDKGIFSSKRMLKHGNILVAEITGGKNTVDSAMKQVELFVNDYHYSNVAIPYQSLVTDRMKEADTIKWVTKIYCPIR